MNPELIKQLEAMSEAEVKELLETQFPEELEKQAAAEVAESELIDALYSYGWLQGERSVAESQGNGDLSKVASAEDIQAHEQAEKEVSEKIEAALKDTGVAATEDEAELHKVAQACASVIFNGYTDSLSKLAEDEKGKKAVKSMADKAKEKLEAAKKGAGEMAGKAKAKASEMAAKAKVHGKAVGAHLMKHKGKYGLGLAGAAALGYGAKKLMDKKASDMTVGELIDSIDSINEAAAGVEKLASVGAAKGEALSAQLKG